MKRFHHSALIAPFRRGAVIRCTLTFVLLALAACTNAAKMADTNPSSATPASQVPSSQDCAEDGVRQLINQFVASYNSGDVKTAESLFATAGFMWYSEPPYRVDAATQSPVDDPKNRSTLGDYLTKRAAQGDKMSVKSFKYNQGGNFEAELARPGGISATKGAITCYPVGPKFIVWSSGQPE